MKDLRISPISFYTNLCIQSLMNYFDVQFTQWRLQIDQFSDIQKHVTPVRHSLLSSDCKKCHHLPMKQTDLHFDTDCSVKTKKDGTSNNKDSGYPVKDVFKLNPKKACGECPKGWPR